ncbi:type VII secretion target [Catenuloplanes atrovinosus]|uniref:Uncharacterized protein YukE n=1 Tax=Catenuloplanes atrovinosus TaxID=137266 RepID=A0AAE3YJW5_9ACTN|nr:hypothetical protein [Catenuloplanes atrovinosus]MDR7274267.1 uncharacterized protein YukE [Catenuloplanes atrovinosus]
MAQTTDVTPDMIRACADRHETTKSNFKRAEDGVTQQVEDLYAKNSGDLMKKLKEIQEMWTGEMEEWQKVLGDLAAYMDECANKLEERNRAQAQELN